MCVLSKHTRLLKRSRVVESSAASAAACSSCLHMCSCKNSGVLTEQTHQPPSLQCAHEPLAAQLVRASQSEATNTDGQKVKEAGEQNGLRHTRGSQPTTQRSHQQYVLLDMRMLNGLAVRFPHDNRRTFLSSLLLSSV